jgi:hypothetical protein
MPREEIAEQLKKGCDGLLCLLTDKIDREMVNCASFVSHEKLLFFCKSCIFFVEASNHDKMDAHLSKHGKSSSIHRQYFMQCNNSVMNGAMIPRQKHRCFEDGKKSQFFLLLTCT